MFKRFGELLAERAATVAGSTIAWGSIDDGGRIGASTNERSGPTSFAIGSITKAFTGTLLARVAERGVVRHDMQLGDVLCELPLRSEVARITLRQLQTHTSGLPRLPANLRPADPGNPYTGYDRDDLFAALAAISDGQIIDGRGSYEYSNFGGGVLGTAVAVAAGRPYEHLLTDEIFHPLGMTNTFVAHAETLVQRAPGLHGFDADGNAVPVWTFDAMAAAGGLISTVPDLLTFARALFDDERWALRSNESWVADGTLRWHNGQTGSHHAMLALDLAERRATVALWNAAADLDDICLHVLDPARSVRVVPEPIRLDPSALARIAGTFRGSSSELVVAVENDRLIVRSALVNGAFYPHAAERFFSKSMPHLELIFSPGPAHEEDTLELTMHGLSFMRAQRRVIA